MMARTDKNIQDLMERVQEAKDRRQRAEGVLENMNKDLKAMGFKTPKEAKAEIAKLEKTLDKLEEELNELCEELEEKLA